MVFNIKSPANIAFVKYWGQRDHSQVIPCNDSFSMNLSHCFTEINFSTLDNVSQKEMFIKEFKHTEYKQATQSEMDKVLSYYEVIRKYLKVEEDIGFTIRSGNSFPKKAGVASSASFFSAMALAFSHAFGKTLSEKELSILARLSGSGSACRSIADGFVWWYAGSSSDDSFAESIAQPEYWDITDLVLVLSYKEKTTSSADGHIGAQSSPYFGSRQKQLPTILSEMKNAFIKKDFTHFGTLVEQEAINFHSILMTQVSPLFFWSDRTIKCIKEIVNLRTKGLEGYFTIDAGENVHLICQSKDAEKLIAHFHKEEYVEDIISNKAAVGTRII